MHHSDEFPYGEDYYWEDKVLLGEGSYGKVFKVKNKKDGQFYAIKSMNMQPFNQDPALMNSLKAQISITSDVSSEYTVKMLANHVGKHYTYIILELCDSDLRNELTSHKFTQPECVKAFEEIILGFQVLINKGYIHRDVKPANVLIKNHHYKVADFGFACKADILGRKKIQQICGTPIYMAPQLLRNQAYTAKSDIWSLGLLLYEMVFGYTPWPSRSLRQYLDNVYNIPLKFPYNAQIGQHTKDFIKKSLVVSEQKRMGWPQLFEHPLVKHKNIGEDAPKVEVNDYIKKILLRIQEDIQRNSINLREVYAPYKNTNLNQEMLAGLIKKITPAITTHQITMLFDYLDTNKDGLIAFKIIEEKVFRIDYRQSGDVLSRKLDQIVAIIRERKEDPALLFQKIDINHSGFLDFSEFLKFIITIAPCYTKSEVLHIFQLFDVDKNGLISKKEFIDLFASKLPAGKDSVSNDRAKRNLRQLVEFMKWTNVSAQTIMKISDKDKNYQLDMQQFQEMISNKMGFHISKDQAIQLFTIIDTSKNGTISVEELASLMK